MIRTVVAFVILEILALVAAVGIVILDYGDVHHNYVIFIVIFFFKEIELDLIFL